MVAPKFGAKEAIMKFDKNSNLDELFGTTPTQTNGISVVDEKDNKSNSFKEDDIRTINKEAAELAKAFEKENKEKLEQMRRDEKEEDRKRKEQAKEAEKELEAIGNDNALADTDESGENKENNQPVIEKKEKKPLSVRLMTFMAIPFIVLGFVMFWNCFVAETYIPMQMNTVIMIIALAFYCLAVVSIVVAIRGKNTVGGIIKLTTIGIISAICAVLSVIYRNELGMYLLLACGIFGIIMAFFYLLFTFLAYAKTNKEKRKFPVYKVIMCCFAVGASVLLIVSNFVTTQIFVSVVGCISFVAGTLMFSA